MEEFLFIARSENLDLLFGLLVDPDLDDCPDACEEHRGIDDEHVAKDLRVVVLGHC